MTTENHAGKLFVLGHARSGTTIIADLLNSDDRVLLLYEAHMFETFWSTRFVSNFNLHHRQAAVFKAKGKFLPSRFDGMKPEAILQDLDAHYRWIGEKVAIGPLSGMGSKAAAQALDYHLSHHLDAHYILTFRAPLASLGSLQRIFPQVSLANLLRGWMLSFIELAAASNLLQRVMLLPVEMMAIHAWEIIRSRLDLAPGDRNAWFDPLARQPQPAATGLALSRELATQLGWPGEQVDAMLARLSEIYLAFLECIDPTTLYYRPSVSFIAEIGDKLITEVHHLVAQLSATEGAGLPTATFCWQNGDEIRSDRQSLPVPTADLLRFSDILRDRLFSETGQYVLSDEHSGYPLEAEGLDIVRDGPLLRLKGKPGAERHRHLTVRVAITPLRVATLRFLLQREQSSRYLMVQIGDDTGFYNSLFDCQQLSVTAMVEVGQVKNLFSKVQLLVDGTIRIAMSGLVSSGKGSYVRIYLCGDDSSIDFDDASSAGRLAITDLVFGYLYEDCGVID